MEKTKKKSTIIALIILFISIIAISIPLSIFIIKAQDTSELVGRVLNVRSNTGESYSTI